MPRSLVLVLNVHRATAIQTFQLYIVETFEILIFSSLCLFQTLHDRLCGLVVRVLGYRSGGPGSILGTTRKKTVVGLERGALSVVNTTEELLDRKVAAPVYKSENTAGGIRHADHVAPSIRKSCQSPCRQAAVARSV
jgi:hypothetical protein